MMSLSMKVEGGRGSLNEVEDFLSVCPRRIPLQLLSNKFYSCLVTNSAVAYSVVAQ